MRILIDARFAASPVGLGRYVRELVPRMVAARTSDCSLLLSATDEGWWLGAQKEHCHLVRSHIPHYTMREQWNVARHVHRAQADILFVPHFNAPLLTGAPFVITVHDLILHRYPGDASQLRQVAYRMLMRQAIRRASGIITVSSFVQEELRTQYPVAVRKQMRVVSEAAPDHYMPLSPQLCRTVLQKYGIDLPFFLYVGSAKEHKNVPFLLDAFRRAQVPNMLLLLVTGGREAHALHPLPPCVRMLSDVPDEDMPALYTAARSLVTASLYEGFGLPIAEALACGCPVIATNRSAIPEVAAGHAQLFEPTIDAYIAAFQQPPQRLPPYRATSWENAAHQTLALLHAVVT